MSLDGLMNRSAKMEAVNSVSDSITSARMDMLYFTTSKDTSRLEALRKNLAKAREGAQTLKPTLADPRNRERMDAIIASVAAYEAGLGRYMESEKVREESLKAVVDAAGNLQKTAEELSRHESEALAKAGSSDVMAKIASVQHKVELLGQQFLRSRIEVLYYLWKGDKSRMDAAKGILEGVISAGRDLQPLVSTGEERALLADIVARAETYRNRMDGFIQAADTQAVVVKELAASAEKAAQAAEEAVDVQRDSMKTESRTANMVNIAVSLAAVVLGVLFAIIITRAIILGVGKAIAVAEAMSHGDLEVEITATGADEIGKLLDAMRRMIDAERNAADIAGRLAEGDLTVTVTPRSDKDVLLRSMAEMVERLRDVVGEVQSGAENVASGSEQMSASAESLSQGATEQASAVRNPPRPWRKWPRASARTPTTPARPKPSPSRPPATPGNRDRPWPRPWPP